MKVEIATLCKHAFDDKGSLTILETMDVIKVDKFPFRATFCFAAKIDLQGEQAGSHTVKITMSLISDKDDNDMVFETSGNIDSKENMQKLNIVLDFNGLIFKESGEYELCTFIDDNLMLSHNFSVIQKEHNK